jgi:hypothetical protein
MKRPLGVLLSALLLTGLTSGAVAAPTFAAENEGGSGGGGGNACELTNSCDRNNPPPNRDTGQVCLAGSGFINMKWNGGGGKQRATGDQPGVPFASLDNADAWATMVGGWAFEDVIFYDIQVANLVGISWSIPGKMIEISDSFIDGIGWTMSTICTGEPSGSTQFQAQYDGSQMEKMLDGWCPTFVNNGSLKGPYARDNTTELAGFSTFNVNGSGLTLFGEGDWRWCYSRGIVRANFDRPLINFGRYLGPVLNLTGSFIVAYRTPPGENKWGWVTRDPRFNFLVLGDTAVDPDRSKYMNNPIEYLRVPGAYQRNCNAEVTITNRVIPGALTPEQVRWGNSYTARSGVARPLYTETLTNPNVFAWTDSDPLYYTNNYAGCQKNPDPTIYHTEATPDLIIQCAANKQNPLFTYPDGRTATAANGKSVDIQANNKAVRINWFPRDEVTLDVSGASDIRDEAWDSRWVVPSTVGLNSPSLIPPFNADLNSMRQPYRTGNFEAWTLNQKDKVSWERFNAWLTGKRNGLSMAMADAAVENRVFQITPTWRSNAWYQTRTRVVTGITTPSDLGATGIAADLNGTIEFRTTWVYLETRCTGKATQLASKRVVSQSFITPR